MKKHISALASILMIVIMFLIGGDRLDHARAQASTSLYFDPSPVEVSLGSTTQIDLMIGNGADINAFEIELNYDSSVIQLDSWSEGGYLSNLMYFVREEEPGRLHLAATQLARPGVSGDGILLNLVFSPVSLGATELILQQVDLALSGGGMLQPAVENGWIDIVPVFEPSATFTRTVVPSSTSTPRPTATSAEVKTPVPTRTLTPAVAFTPTLKQTTITETGEVSSQLVSSAVPGKTATLSVSTTPGSSVATARSSTGLQQKTDSTEVLIAAGDKSTATPGGADQADNRSRAALNSLLWLILVVLAILLVALLLRFVISKKKV